MRLTAAFLLLACACAPRMHVRTKPIEPQQERWLYADVYCAEVSDRITCYSKPEGKR